MDSATNLHRKAFDSCKLSVYIWLLGTLPPDPHRGSAPRPHCETSVPQVPCAHPDFRTWLRHCLLHVAFICCLTIKLNFKIYLSLAAFVSCQRCDGVASLNYGRLSPTAGQRTSTTVDWCVLFWHFHVCISSQFIVYSSSACIQMFPKKYKTGICFCVTFKDNDRDSFSSRQYKCALIVWLIDRSIVQLIDWLIDWVIDWLTDWSIDRLIMLMTMMTMLM